MKEEAKIKKGTFTFADGVLKEDRTSTYYYTDEYFRRNAAILNPHLRTMSFALCMACFPSTKAENYERVYRNAEALLTEIGFSDFTPNEDYKVYPTTETLGMLLAHKVIEDQGEEYSLIAMGLRGAGYGDEWASNLLLDEKGPATGFNECMHYADTFLCSYMEQLGDKLRNKVKYWITGYSRVAGVSNLLGAWIDRYAKAYRTETGNIFVYTFEGPAAASKEDRRPYPSIHNTINPHDIVPRLAPDAWGFKRYGVDDTVLPAIHSEEYEEKIGEVRERLHELNPTFHYDPLEFQPTFLKGSRIENVMDYETLEGRRRPDEWWYHVKQDEFLDRFMDFIAKKISHPEDGYDPTDRERRERFVATYQDSFSSLAKTYLGGSEDERTEMVSVVKEIASKDLNKRRKLFLFIKLWQNREYNYHQVEQFINHLVKRRVTKESTLELDGTAVGDFLAAVERMLYYGIKCASYDMRRHRLSYITTIASNAAHLKMAHMPEVIMAWLQTYDSYYHKDMSKRLEENT